MRVVRAREALRQTLPDSLRDSTFAVLLKDDPGTKRWLVQLVTQLGGDASMVGVVAGGAGGAGPATFAAIHTTMP